MNKKGFTLIETIVVIAIIALIFLLLVPNVLIFLNKNNEKSCNNLKENIISSAKLYVTYNKHDLGFTCDNKVNISLETLVKSGDLKLNSDNKIINPIDNSEIPLSTKIEVKYDCNTDTFIYTLSEDIDCSSVRSS